MARRQLLGPALGLVVVSALVLLGPPNAAAASCRYVPTVADGRLRGPFTISSGTQDLDFFFQARYFRSYSVEALIVSEPYYVGSLSANTSDADCPTSDMFGVRRTETIDPGPADFFYSSPGEVPFYRASFIWLGGGVGYVDVRIGSTLPTGVQIVISVTETTMFSPAWSTNGSYDTFYSFQNTTNASCHADIDLRDLAGSPVKNVEFDVASGTTASLNTASLGITRNAAGVAWFQHNCPPGAILVAAAIANFTLSPTPYYQAVKFEAVRAAH